MNRYYIIVNTDTGEYIQIPGGNIDENWNTLYPHLEGCKWPDCHSVWEHDMTPSGMFYTYDLCCDGMLATLLVDDTVHDDKAIAEAKSWMNYTHDVVRLQVSKIRPVATPGFVVLLEDGCWKAPWSGDPGRTTERKYAKVFKTEHGARRSIWSARKYRPFVNAKVEPLVDKPAKTD